MSERKLTGRQILELFYSEVGKADASPAAPNGGEGPGDGPAPDSRSLFRCKCGKIRAQRLKHGYTNLVQHVLVKHPEWLEAAAREAHPAPKPAVANSIKAPQEKADAPQSKAKTKAAAASTDESDVVPVRVDAEADAADVASDGSSGSSNGCSEADDSSAEETRTTTSLDPTPAPPTVSKRTDYLSWDDYFMSVAFLSAMRSKDPSTQVGACIVSPERKIVGIGYNGFPNGCNDDHLPWARESATASPLDTKYPYVCHAEMNAILNKNSTDVKGCTIYVALFPCNECAKLIIQSGISRVVYCSDKYNKDWKFVASRRLLDMAGVRYVQHQLQLQQVVIDFSSVQ